MRDSHQQLPMDADLEAAQDGAGRTADGDEGNVGQRQMDRARPADAVVSGL